AATVSAAVEAATAAFPGWAATPPVRRARVMFRFREILEREARALAAIITAEHRTRSRTSGPAAAEADNTMPSVHAVS
ncbi:aldehyde dehydrogenase family protein, partial [Roseomonas elaeocarpi]